MTLIVWTLVLCVLMYGPVTEACPSRCSCNRSTSCNGAFVNCLLKGLTEVPFYIPTNTCELNLNGNNITTLEDSAFDMLSSLRKLILNAKNITTPEDSVFDRLSSLRKLWLASNKISIIHTNAFNGLPNLQELYIYNNKITVLNKDIFLGLSKLETLAVNGNPLHCGCILNDFVRFSQSRNLTLGRKSEPTCSTPSNLARVFLRDLPLKDMDCDLTTAKTPVKETSAKISSRIEPRIPIGYTGTNKKTRLEKMWLRTTGSVIQNIFQEQA